MATRADVSSTLAERELLENVRLRERELALKEADLELRRKEANKSWLSSPAVLALAAAALGLGGNALVAWYNASAALTQEAAKAEYARVLEMIKVGNPELASKNLEMLLQTGLYTDRDGKLQRYINEHRGGQGAFLPVPAAPGASSARLSAQDNALLRQALQSEAAEWMKVAQKEIGVTEVPGDQTNPRIAAYHQAAGLEPDDSIPWVGSFMCWTFKQVGMECPSNAGAALSWAQWGQPIGKPKPGAIAVFQRPRGTGGTVGFYLSEDYDAVRILTGNVSDRVGVVSVPKDRVVGYRWPADA